MTPEFWVTVFAIILGPIVAVLLTHYLQRRTFKRDQKLYVFRVLMSTRRTPLSAERVQALNLVDVEFYGNSKVSARFQSLLETYNDQTRWKSDDPEIREMIIQEVGDKTTELLKTIGADLGYKLENLELLRGGYYPEAFSIAEQQNLEIRDFIIELRRGVRSLPVDVLDVRHPDKMLVEAREKELLVSVAGKPEQKK
ncbi:MAG: DUF6680 family protein [Arenibacterium sp.]